MKKIIVFIVVALTVISCTKKQENTALVIGVMPSMDWLPLAVAEREGYFNDAGVNVVIKKFYSANERDAAFQSGNIDGTVIDYTGAVLQKAGGIDLKLVSKCDAPFYVISGKNSGIKTIEDLRGKKVAVSQNTVIDYLIDKALSSKNIKSTEIDKVEINIIPLRFEMLQNNKIDATGLPDPLAIKALLAGDNLIVTNNDLGMAITGIMFTGNALKSKNSQIEKMYKAYDMGVQYLNDNPTGSISDILIKDIGFTEDIIPKAKLPAYTKAVPPSIDDINMVADWLVSKGLIAAFDSPGLIGDVLTQ